MKRKSLGSLTSATIWAIGIGLLLVTCAVPCHAQSLPPLRRVYTPGFNATNSGVMPEPGLTYWNTFTRRLLRYSDLWRPREEERAAANA
jgi:hypothetical protein